MTRSRRPLCTHDADAPLFPTIREKSYDADDPDAVDAALEHLAEVLNTLPDPIEGAVGALTTRDISVLLKATPLNHRQHALGFTGIPITPRNVGQALCDDVLRRLERIHLHDVVHTGAILCRPVSTDLFMAAACDEDDEPWDLSVWSDAVLRFALWTGLTASLGGSRVLVWAARQPWFLPSTLSEAHREEIRVAAQAVIDLTPEYDADDFVDLDDADADSDAVDEPSASQPTAGHDCATADDSAATTAALNLSVRSGHPMTTSTTSMSRPDALAALHADRERLESVLAAARAAAERVAPAVDAGHAPDAEDLAALVALREALQTLAAALPDDVAELSIEAVDAGIAALEQQNSQLSIRDRLAALRTLTGGDLVAAALGDLRNLIDMTLDGLEHADPALIDGLLALADLVDLIAAHGAAQADPQRMLELQGRATSGLPRLSMLCVAAMAGQLGWGVEETEDRPAPTRPVTAHSTAPSAIPAASAHATAGEIGDAGIVETPQRSPDRTQVAEPVPAAEELQAVEGPGADTAAVNPPAAEPPSRPSASAAPAAPRQPSREQAARRDEQAVGGTRSPNQTAVAATLADLIRQRRFGLAAVLAEKSGMSQQRVAALRLSTLADAVRAETGPCAARLRVEVPTLEADEIAEDSAAMRLAVPALVRVAFVTGDPAPGALLTRLSSRLESNLALIADQVGRLALQGVLVGNPLRTVLADVGELTAQVRHASAAAAERLRPRTLRFKRATDIAHEWLTSTGMLGTLLTAAARDDRSRLVEVKQAVLRLSDHSVVSKEIDRFDAKYKGSSGRPVQGRGRQDLFNLVTDALSRVSAWLESVDALDHARHAGSSWATAELTDVRAVVLEHADGALQAFDGDAGRGDVVARAAAVAGRAMLATTVALLDGSAALPPGEPLADLALTAELLKVAGATVEPSRGLVSAPAATVADLVTAAGRAWQNAFDTQVAAEEYPTARFLLDAARSATLPGSDDVALRDEAAESLRVAEHRSRAQLQQVREQLLGELRRARLRNEISEEQDGELTARLDSADPATEPAADGPPAWPSMAAVRAQLGLVAELLPAYRDEAAHRLEERLQRLVEQPVKRVPVDDEHIRRLIASGDLSTAEELIYYCEVGEEVPRVTVREDPTRFFPAVPDTLPAGITAELLDTVVSGGVLPSCDVLDFSELSEDARVAAAEALKAWRLAGSTPVAGRNGLNERAQMLPALRLAGFEFSTQTKATRLANVPKGGDRRFIELTDVSTTGKATVPQFGSGLGGRLRVLLCWGRPGEELLMSWVGQDTSSGPILVAYFGTMSALVRRRLAARTVQTDSPVIVLDDAALAYLAAHGGRQLAATLAILLPFSAVQPYVRHKRSLVAPEMFYGRDKERKAVLDPNGTQILFGGRGLGKSALLRAAKVAFEAEPERVALHIELTTANIGPGRQGADAVWDLLLRDLDGTVITLKATERRGKRSHDIVRAGVRDWLDGDDRRRLLILLDESDGFFESDSTQFLETNRLKDLGQMPAFEGRVKVVFAGLHSVQRFAKVSNNTFKHLAQRPTVIGPLRPQFAYNLIARPMEALGYTFADADLVNRILGYCSYQPFLLQMFAHRLVEYMHGRRGARRDGVRPDEPPFVVGDDDVMAVEADPELKGDITSTFHDTLHLDPRYNVIANVLAYHAHEHGMDHRLTEPELREECLSYWPEGFSGLDLEAFRAYLHEMAGLGVLAPNNDQRGWHLRSPNVLRMIGSKLDVISQLLHAASETVPSEFIALSARRQLPDGTRAPLTAGQVDDLLGDHTNQVRLVLGSYATRVEEVAATMRAVCDDLAGRYTLVQTTGRKQFDDALVEGRPGDRRVVLSDLVAMRTKDDGCQQSLQAALAHRPTAPGVTRAVVLVAGPDQMRFWQQALAGGKHPGLGVVTLRRLDRRALHVWSLETGHFTSPERQARLLDVTGGWPHLTERSVALAVKQQSEDGALAELEMELASDEGAADLIDTVGLTADEQIAAAFDSITSYVDEDASVSDLLDAIAMSDHLHPEAALACLEALAVFDVEPDGTHRVEPLLVRCWPYRRHPARADD